MRIYLVGFMGCGKSTYGKELAEILEYPCIDLDAEIEKSAGLSVTALMKDKGEAEFRKTEAGVLRDTAKLDNAVIATGGGAAAYDENMAWMNAHGLTVYLKMFEPDLVNRLSAEQESRPLIKDMDTGQLQEFVHKKLRERSPFYTSAAITLDPVNLQPELFAEIVKQRK